METILTHQILMAKQIVKLKSKDAKELQIRLLLASLLYTLNGGK